MSPSLPPPAQKRPWYLFAALVAGWIYGAQALSEGYDIIAYYRGEQADVHALADDVHDGKTRESITSLADRWVALKDASKGREYPLGVASLLLGGAMILFAARSMAGREGARSALIQVVLVHGGVVVAWYLLTMDATRAWVTFAEAIHEALARLAGEKIPPEWERASQAAARLGPAIAIAVRSVASGLIILALTRPRARAFFESVPPQLGEG